MKEKVSLEVKITDRCNERCFHCVNEDSPKKKRVIDWTFFVRRLEEWAKTRDRYPYTIEEIRMTGGEPLLYPDAVLGIAKSCQRLAVCSGVNTNGTRLTPSLLAQMKDTGLSIIKISFDAITEDTFQKMRDSDSSLQSLNRHIKKAVKKGFKVILRLTLCRYNRDQLISCYKAARDFGVYKFQVKPLINVGRAAETNAFLTKEEVNQALHELLESFENPPPEIEILCWPPPESARFKYKICGNLHKVYFTPRLQAIICNFVPNSRIIGSLRKDSLDTVLRNRGGETVADNQGRLLIKGCPNSVYFEIS